MTNETPKADVSKRRADFPVAKLRKASSPDLPIIRKWLAAEEVDGFGFIHNWGIIENAFAEGVMTVFDGPEGPVAFITRGISYGTILQTRSSHLRRGIARLLVQHELRREEALGNAVVAVQCCPSTSVAFWTAMGFEPHRERSSDSIFMHHLSRRINDELIGEDLQSVTIRTYPESALYSKTPMAPDRVYCVNAWHDPQYKTLDLAHRVSIANETALGDVAVEVSWNNRTIYLGKAKREKAMDIGLCPTPNGCGWYLDWIDLSQAQDL